MLARARKTKDQCPMCAASRTLCLCDVVPRIELKTKICLVIHRSELKRSSNTGLLAVRALVNSEIRIRGEGRETLDLKDLLSPQYRTFLFYPSEDAVELDRELVVQERRPIQLIVPDGTWRQARKIHSRHHELKDVQRVKISTPNNSAFQLRAQSRPEGMATLQAIAHGLGVIEGDLVRAQLMKLYHAKIERTLIGRGQRRRFMPIYQ
jgi:tRNA-uridine aminocarboxypropyltransferase